MKDGGPAFPAACEFDNGAEWVNNPGMTLRDYFAAKALIHMAPIVVARMEVGREAYEPSTLVAMCYELADAMLAARGV